MPVLNLSGMVTILIAAALLLAPLLQGQEPEASMSSTVTTHGHASDGTATVSGKRAAEPAAAPRSSG